MDHFEPGDDDGPDMRGCSPCRILRYWLQISWKRGGNPRRCSMVGWLHLASRWDDIAGLCLRPRGFCQATVEWAPLVSKISKNTCWLDLRKKIRNVNIYVNWGGGENFTPNLNFNDKHCFHMFWYICLDMFISNYQTQVSVSIDTCKDHIIVFLPFWDQASITFETCFFLAGKNLRILEPVLDFPHTFFQ